jgi:hypothetical protein
MVQSLDKIAKQYDAIAREFGEAFTGEHEK